MADNDERLKAQMMAQVEATVERLLAERAKKGQLDLSDIEHLVREAGERVMQELTSGLVDAEADTEKRAECPECGQRLLYKGKRGRDLVTQTGEAHLKRGYYYCPTCRKGIFPPRPTVGSGQDGL